MWIDTHAHLYVEAFDQDRNEMVNRAKSSGVDKIILPNIDLNSIPSMLKLAEEYEGEIFHAMGLHPCSVKEGFQEDLEILKNQLEHTNPIAIGETGLDLYWDKTTKEIQLLALAEQVKWAEEMNLPIIIHARESLDELIEFFRSYRRKIKGVFHCFTGTVSQASEIVDMGFHLGLGGVVTFKNGGVREILRELPLERIVLETDAPYLAPKPYRGKRNESAYIPIIGEVIAAELEISLDELASSTTDNARKLFGLS